MLGRLRVEGGLVGYILTLFLHLIVAQEWLLILRVLCPPLQQKLCSTKRDNVFPAFLCNMYMISAARDCLDVCGILLAKYILSGRGKRGKLRLSFRRCITSCWCRSVGRDQGCNFWGIGPSPRRRTKKKYNAKKVAGRDPRLKNSQQTFAPNMYLNLQTGKDYKYTAYYHLSG